MNGPLCSSIVLFWLVCSPGPSEDGRVALKWCVPGSSLDAGAAASLSPSHPRGNDEMKRWQRPLRGCAKRLQQEKVSGMGRGQVGRSWKWGSPSHTTSRSPAALAGAQGFPSLSPLCRPVCPSSVDSAPCGPWYKGNITRPCGCLSYPRFLSLKYPQKSCSIKDPLLLEAPESTGTRSHHLLLFSLQSPLYHFPLWYENYS